MNEIKILRNHTSNHFCGPAAIAALTGVHVDDAARVLRNVSGKRAIMGIDARHMLAALKKLGHEPHTLLPVTTGKRPTLTQALAGVLRDRKPDEAFLVTITDHYVVIKGRRLWDNKHPEGIWLGECPYRRKRVRAIWAVSAGAQPVTLPPKPMSLSQFTLALDGLGLTTDGEYVDAPEHRRFRQNDTHVLAITGTYEEMLAQVHQELPLEACPEDCECRDETDE